jgi:hypothetical protein
MNRFFIFTQLLTTNPNTFSLNLLTSVNQKSNTNY